MVKIPDLVLNKIMKFLQSLERNNFRIQKAYLFGSYVNGKYNDWSDIDLALVSDDFKGDSFQDRLSLIDLIYECGSDISPVPYRIIDFENSMFARDEIVKNGIQLV